MVIPLANYHNLSVELQEKIRRDRQEHVENPYRFLDENIIRRQTNHDRANLWRPAFVRDVEKILHIPYYNRYSDKTQVFSFFRNDDISRRALHVQLVARIARNIGSVLQLNTDLIEAIALGHDLGHTPFGHAGERILSELLQKHTGRYFNHNVHSVRVLDGMMHRNISLQVLDGVLCHNGELELKEYRPCQLDNFEQFDEKVEKCYVDASNIATLIPSTLEGCVVRISDIIAYLGKDRQDAMKLSLLASDSRFTNGEIGSTNAEIINNLIVNIIENSYGKPYLLMDKVYFDELKRAKSENYKMIYGNDKLNKTYNEQIAPMMEEIYEALLVDAKEKRKDSILYQHHVSYVKENNRYTAPDMEYEDTQPDQMVVDFIASMTDDYFLALYRKMFPKGKYHVDYVGYF